MRSSWRFALRKGTWAWSWAVKNVCSHDACQRRVFGEICPRRRREHPSVASYAVNKRAVGHARQLIERRQYVVRSEWGEAQPNAADQDAYLASHGWEEYAAWHLGLTEGPGDETKARYAFVYGNFRRVHRSGLIACVYRAAEWDHKEIELAAHKLLQQLDKTRAKSR
jgi:hypothetical protein